LRDAFHKLAVELASEAGHVLAVAHLYRAAKQTHPRNTTWRAMDFFIARQGADWLYGAGSPVESVCAALGVRFDAHVKSRKKSHVLIIREPRALAYLSRRCELSVMREKGTVVAVSDAGRDVLAMARAMTSDTSTPLLDAFGESLHGDEAALSFDILGLHRTCLVLLEDIQKHCVKHAPDVYVKSGNVNLVAVQVLGNIDG
jgi:hypothetical protein